jgi:hypothetical protein
LGDDRSSGPQGIGIRYAPGGATAADFSGCQLACIPLQGV